MGRAMLTPIFKQIRKATNEVNEELEKALRWWLTVLREEICEIRFILLSPLCAPHLHHLHASIDMQAMGGVRAEAFAAALRREEHASENRGGARGRWPHRVRRLRAFQGSDAAVHS